MSSWFMENDFNFDRAHEIHGQLSGWIQAEIKILEIEAVVDAFNEIFGFVHCSRGSGFGFVKTGGLPFEIVCDSPIEHGGYEISRRLYRGFPSFGFNGKVKIFRDVFP